MAKNLPKVSIVLPTYNGSSYIRQSIESCLKQTYKNIELLIVDDGLTDETPNIIKSYKDKRIKYFRHKKNKGLPKALNTGFANTTGDYLTWTSDDNEYLPEAIEKLVSCLEKSKNIDLVYADYWEHFVKTNKKILRKLPDKLDLKKENLLGPCFLYTRRVYQEIGEYNPEYLGVEDYDYWIRTASKFQMKHCPYPLYIYKRHRQSLSSTKIDTIILFDKILKYQNGFISLFEAKESIFNFFLSVIKHKKSKDQALLSCIQNVFGIYRLIPLLGLTAGLLLIRLWELKNVKLDIKDFLLNQKGKAFSKSMTKKLKILHTVEFYYPSMGGAQEVVKQLSERLVKLGHRVTVATSYLPERKKTKINGVKIRQFKIKGNLVRGITGNIENYQKFVLNGNFDIILNYAAQQWTVDAILPLLSKIKSKKIFVPCGFSGLYEKEYKKYFKEMPNYLKQYDWLVFLSGNYRDINFARKHGFKNFSVIPNGAGKDEFLGAEKSVFRKKYKLKNHFIILTVGSHTGAKGHYECIEAFKRAKIENSVLVIIGNVLWDGGCYQECLQKAKKYNFRNFFSKNKILLLDPPRKEVIQAFLDADLFVLASNIECSPLVLFEAMASKTAFLTVPVGNAREIIHWGQGGLPIKAKKRKGYIYADIDDFSGKIKNLYNNPLLKLKFANNGFQAWQKKFTWERIVKDYESLYQSLTRWLISLVEV